MIRTLKALFILSFLVISQAARSGPLAWGNQTLANNGAWTTNPTFYGPSAAMVLREGRYPFIVYLDRTSSPCLRSVCWNQGEKQDEMVLSVNFSINGLKLASNGTDIVVGWSVALNSMESEILISRLTETGWTEAESVTSGTGIDWDIAVNSQGQVLLLTAQDSFHSANLYLRTRSIDGWNTETIAQDPMRVSGAWLHLSPDDIPTAAWRAFSISGDGARVSYATKRTGQWVQTDLQNIKLLDAVFPGADGEPWAIGTQVSGSVPLLLPLNGEASASVPLTGFTGSVTSGATLPDGTVYATLGRKLVSGRDGIWTSIDSATCHSIRIGLDGVFHCLSGDDSLVQYQTLVPPTWGDLALLTTYEQGGAEFQSLVLSPAGAPQIFGYLNSGGIRFEGVGGAWQSKPPVDEQFLWDFAIDRQGVLRGFQGTGRYASWNSQGGIQAENLPVSVMTSSSSSRYGFVLDSMNRPHVGFYTGLGTGSALVKYGVKTGGNWIIETVTTASYSDQHCAVAVDGGDNPWMFNSQGLFKRGPGGWVKEYDSPSSRFPGLGIATDGTVYALFCRGERLHGLTGRNGIYTVQVLDVLKNSGGLGFTMSGDRPTGIYIRNFDVSSEVLVHVENTGNQWRHRLISPFVKNRTFSAPLAMVADDTGLLTCAGRIRESRDSYTHSILFAVQGSVTPTDPASLAIGHHITRDRKHRFSVDLGSLPYRQEIEFQGTGNFEGWTTLCRLGSDVSLSPGVEGLTVKGDPFRAALTFDLPPALPAYFVRMAVDNP